MIHFIESRVGCYDGLSVGPNWEGGDSSVSAAVLDSLKAMVESTLGIAEAARLCLTDQKMASVTALAALLCRIGVRVQGRIAETADCEGQRI